MGDRAFVQCLAAAPSRRRQRRVAVRAAPDEGHDMARPARRQHVRLLPPKQGFGAMSSFCGDEVAIQARSTYKALTRKSEAECHLTAHREVMPVARLKRAAS